MRWASICSGIGAPEVAWHDFWGPPVFVAEIDAFPSAVLKHRFPSSPNYGDFTKIGAPGGPTPDGPIDLLVGGTPCQSFSVAGKRAGLDDPRGDLTLEFFALARRLRPRWLVWENVPGVLSDDGGETFATVLGLMGQLGYGYAYRVLDAQFFGVAQRRRRVFLVGCLGEWTAPAAVLFEPESLRGDSPPSRGAGPGAARSTGGAADGGGLVNALNASRGGPDDSDAQAGTIVAYGGNNGRGPIDVATATNTKGQRNDFTVETFIAFNARQDPCPGDVVQPLDTDGTTHAIAFSCKDHGADAGVISPTLRAMGHDKTWANGGGQVAVAVPILKPGKRTGKSTTDPRAGMGVGGENDPAFTLQAGAQQGVAVAFKPSHYTRDKDGAPAETFPPLTAEQDRGDQQAVAAVAGSVRRLTPTEWERLQGFPDGWTAIPYKGKPAADSPRYKALGNSMAVPVVAWIGRRIRAVDDALKSGLENTA